MRTYQGMGPEERVQILELLDLQVTVLESGSRTKAPKVRITGHVTDEFELGIGKVERGESRP